MSIVTLRRGSGRDDGVELGHLAARGGVLARLDWPLASPDTEGIAADIAWAVAVALCACGRVAFRADAPNGDARWLPPRHVGSVTRGVAAVGRALGVSAPDRAGVLITESPAVAATLFDFAGWSAADQRVLVFAPDDAGENDIVAAVREVDDWHGRSLPAAARLLLGPGHDGDFAGIAAAETSWLDRFADALV